MIFSLLKSHQETPEQILFPQIGLIDEQNQMHGIDRNTDYEFLLVS